MILSIFFGLLSAILWSGSFPLKKRGLEKVDYKIFICLVTDAARPGQNPVTFVAGLKRTAPLFTVALSVFMLWGKEKAVWKTFVIAVAIVMGAILAITG